MKGKVKSMIEIRDIIHRLRMGQSKRRIHKDLKVHRSTIRELHNLAVVQHWLDPEQPMPNDEEIAKFWNRQATVQPHPLDIYREKIEQWDKEGRTSVVIHQLLKDQCNCDVQVIRRYRQKHFPKPVQPVMVRSTVPGEIMDIDFGELGRFLDADRTLRRVWLFSLRLRHSRKAFRMIVLDQKAQTFLMGHVYAFEYFNGVPKTCVLDNLKAGVIRSTIDNDMINRSYQELAEHYGFIISPCLPRTPEHKGGVESDVKYSKQNFLSYFLAKQKEMGIEISTIEDLSDFLAIWDKEVADVHLIHGIGRSPLDLFKSEEEKVLKPLPKSRWEPTSWSQGVVRKEWRIMVNSAYYSVPFRLIGETVDICTTHSLVRIFHQNKEVALHERAGKKWEYKRNAEHAPPFEEAVLQSSRGGLLALAEDVCPFTYQVAHTILSHPSVDKLRPVRLLLDLARKYSKERLEKACSRAFSCKLFSTLSVKNILENNLDSQPLEIHKPEKIVSLPRPRFARDPADYKSTYSSRETFEEKLQGIHPISKHGNALLGVFEGLLADQMEEEERSLKKGKNE